MGIVLLLLFLIVFLWICAKFLGGLMNGKTISEAARATKPKDREQALLRILRILLMYIPAGIWGIALILILCADSRYFLLFALLSSIFMVPWLWLFNWFLKK